MKLASYNVENLFRRARAATARRKRQAERVKAIYESVLAAGSSLVAVIGDFNDTPDSAPMAPLTLQTALKDVSEHPKFAADSRPGTYGNGAKGEKIDYILLSPKLFAAVKAGGVERRGVWGGANGDLFPLPALPGDHEARPRGVGSCGGDVPSWCRSAWRGIRGIPVRQRRQARAPRVRRSFRVLQDHREVCPPAGPSSRTLAPLRLRT
ncbi:MAG: hypothetical protein HY825_01940 [Acidobacteria bacterium]|nr:hypothetical protein [Acidobacteriota bacterium]